LAILLAYCVWHSVRYAVARETLVGTTSLLRIPQFYGVVSMTLGYIFISVHYLAKAAAAVVAIRERGADGIRQGLTGALAGAAIAAVVWLMIWGVLATGASALIGLGVLFVALTLAGNPIIFMLSIVGIVSVRGIAGLTFYPSPDVLFPFRTTQSTMGLGGYSELIVVLMFLIVAELMNASGMSHRLITFAAACVGHLRGGMAYVCQVTSAFVSGISGSAQADAAIMTPLLVPAMEKEGYPKDVAAAVVAGASIKGPIGPISVMFIAYGVLVANVSIGDLLLSGVVAELLLLLFQAATVYVVVRRLGFFKRREFAGMATVARTGWQALPVILVPFIIVGGILKGVFTPSESGAAALVVALMLAMFWYAICRGSSPSRGSKPALSCCSWATRRSSPRSCRSTDSARRCKAFCWISQVTSTCSCLRSTCCCCLSASSWSRFRRCSSSRHFLRRLPTTSGWTPPTSV
jgi:hypothetical protein